MKDWTQILERAAAIIAGYDTGVTLRQLFYRLVAAGILQNRLMDYKTLSARTAAARRAGAFPSLIDQTREIIRYQTWTSPESARAWLARRYRRDRTEGQEAAVYIGAEKATLLALLDAWFADYGVPLLLLRGYGSQTYLDDIAADVEAQGRPAVLLYAGDFDPSGEDIQRDLIERTGGAFAEIRRVAVLPEQIDALGLVPMPGKASDSRAAGFVARHGELVQVEVEAIEPNTLQSMMMAAFRELWDFETYDSVLEQETAERANL
jgi:hypothetical protein